MENIFMLLLLILWLNIHQAFFSIFKIKSTVRNQKIYSLVGFIITGVCIFLWSDPTSNAVLVSFLIYGIGLSLQIIYWFLRKPAEAPLQNDSTKNSY